MGVLPSDPAPEAPFPSQSPRLYHYTDPAGLQGIVLGGNLWATVARFLNDTSEVSRAFDLAASRVQGHPQLRDGALQPGIERFVTYVRDSGGVSPNHLIISFSEDPDVLSQWRAYGGFAVGFDWQTLRDLSEAQKPDWHLIRCRYSPAEQEAVIDKAILSAVTTLTLEGGLERWGDEIDTRVFNLLYARVLQVAPAVKNASFAEEREWRLATVNPADGRTLRIRPTKTHSVPYGEFPIIAADGGSALREIVVGPSPHQARATQGVAALLAAADGKEGRRIGVSTRASRIPYLP